MALQDNRDSALEQSAAERAAPPSGLAPAADREHHPGDQEHAHHHEHDHDHEHGHEHDHSFEWLEAARIGIVSLAAALVWFRLWEPYAAVSVIGVIGLTIGGWPILKEAFENILERRMTMELSMTIAIVAAAAIGEFFTALVITLFVLIAEVLEGMTVGRGRKAIRDLLEFLPREVAVRRAGSIRSVAAEALTMGDAVLVAPGGRIPVDGTVLTGNSFVDESRITGESMPTQKTAGAHVFGVNQPVGRARNQHRARRARYELRQDHRSRGTRCKISRASAAPCRSYGWLFGLFCSRGGSAYFPDHA
jgi:cation transport ATPase